MSATTFYNSTNLVGIGTLNAASVSTTLANVIQANIQSMNVSGDSNLSGNLITGNIIMASNLSTNSGQGNVYISANLVVNGNIFSIGGSVGSGSGTSQGVTYVLPSSYSLGTAFATGSAGPGIAGFHINMSLFGAQAIAAVSSFSASSGMLKFTSAGLYSVQCVLVGDQPAAKVGIGSTSSASFPPSVTATSGYVYVYNYPLNSSPTTLVTIPLNITDVSKWYYLDAYFSTGATLLYQTAPPSGSAAGSNYGTYVQVGPFGNYLTSATGVASALLANCSASSTLSGSYSSNAYRVTLTSSNGWTVSGVSTSLAVTANGNFQVNQAGLYEVNMCLNTVGQTPVQFQVGSLSSDTATPGTSTPAYLYTYAPMYTQDPTTTISMPVNITTISNVYFVEVSFQGTSTATIPLNTTSTFVSIKPIGSYVTPSTNPWGQQGSSVYYNSGPVGLGMNPSALTETLTVSGNTSFVSNVTVTSDVSGSAFVSAKRTPAGSLSVANYITGSVPLTTTTNLIQNYLSNAATISATGVGGYGPTIYYPGTANSRVVIPYQTSVMRPASNLFMEAWVYLGSTSAPSTFAIFTSENTAGGSDDFSVRFLGNPISSVQFYIYNTVGPSYGASATYSFPVGWVYIAASFNAAAGTTYIFYSVSGTSTVSTTGTWSGTQRVTAGNNLYIGSRQAPGTDLNGHIYDARIIRGGVVPTGTYTINSSTPYLFSAAPTYVTGMSTGYTSNLTLALQSQYFPSASTSPYGPCLTLPGTVGSYYAESGLTHSDWKGTGGFTCEAWVNYASLASANALVTGASQMYTIVAGQPTSTGNTWTFGATTTGALAFGWRTSTSTASMNAFVTSNTLATGSWNHVLVQSNASNVYMAINGNFTTLTAQGFTPTNGSGTIAPSIAPSTSNTASSELSYPVTVGQFNSLTGPNVAVAKARLIYGANVYSSGSFTPNPNFATSATAPFWQLETQYPLPTFPSIQDVTELPAQASSFGTLPAPVGGVTSNVLGPYPTTYPQLDSIRFDGTGYIDYGNAATSVVNSNLWATPWTIEGWVYPTTQFDSPGIFGRGLGTSTDFQIWLTNSTPASLYFGGSGISSTGGGSVSYNTWSHIAVVYNNSTGQITGYVNGSTAIAAFTPGALPYTPTYVPRIGYYFPNGTSFQGNLADVRVSNVARYTGSSYTVPSAPFATDPNTLLLLKSLGGQTGTTLEVQGRGLNAVSLGATRSVQSYPPAPMSSYLLDTTSNSSVSYGVGKYVASASSEYSIYTVWSAFTTTGSSNFWNPNYNAGGTYGSSSPYTYTGSVVTVDILGNSYAGEWIQLQIPVSVILNNYSVAGYTLSYSPTKWWVLGSRDGTNWTLVDARTGITNWSGGPPTVLQTFTTQGNQGYNFYRMVINQLGGYNSPGVLALCRLLFNGTEESLCITSDAKVGVGIANPQRALEVAGDLVVSGTISGGAGMGSFRNRIINGDMRIAQRGTSNVVGTGQTNYMIDRFYASIYPSGTLILTQTRQTLVASDTPYQLGIKYSLRVASANGGTIGVNALVTQPIEGQNGTIDLNWGTSFGAPVTLSFWVRTNAVSGTVFAGSITNSGYNSSYNFQYTATSTSGLWQYITFTLPPPPNGTTWTIDNTAGIILNLWAHQISPGGNGLTSSPFTWVSGNYQGTFAAAATPWWQNAGNFIEFTGIQLEKGTVATPFEFRPYATELQLCQRYYWNFSSAGGVYTGFGSGYTNGTSALIIVPFPVQMRAQPTQNSNSAMSTFVVLSTGLSVSPSALTTFTAGLNSSILTFTVSGQTAGQGAILQANNTTGAFVAFGAEL
jgi:hypothetical protein